MKMLKTLVAAAVALSFAVPAMACDKDKTAKIDKSRQQTASQTTNTKPTKPGS